MSKHIVTYCVMDTDAEANPFGHACLLLSRQEDELKPVEVVNAAGFYSSRSSTVNPIYRFIKFILGFAIDLQDSSGMLREEEIRYLDKKRFTWH